MGSSPAVWWLPDSFFSACDGQKSHSKENELSIFDRLSTCSRVCLISIPTILTDKALEMMFVFAENS